ncbi:MAG: YihY/virulence factor BrkB family protein [Bacteroidota bacterium]
MLKRVAEIRKFLQEDLWKVKIKSLPRRKAFLYRQLRILMITFSEFQKDKCSEKASALTYFSLLSVVPVVALAYGIATAFGLKDYLKGELQTYLSDQQEVYTKINEWADTMLSGASGGVISGIGTIILIYAVVRLLNNIETAFNDIWATEKGRNLKRMLTDYMTVIFLGPILIIISGAATAFITTEVETLTSQFEFLGFIKPGIIFILQVVPYTLIWFLLFLVYMVFPNAPVKLKPALIAGIFAGTLYLLVQLAWIEGQVFLSKYNTIYGTFAAVPLFLMWMQLSWIVVLLGAELAYAIQNVTSWSYDNEKLNINIRTRRKLTMLILKHIINHFIKEDGPISFDQLASELIFPHRFVREGVNELEKSGLILRVKHDDQELYAPGLDINKIDIATVLGKLEDMGLDNLPQQHQNKEFHKINQAVESIEDTIRNSPTNKLIKDL